MSYQQAGKASTRKVGVDAGPATKGSSKKAGLGAMDFAAAEKSLEPGAEAKSAKAASEDKPAPAKKETKAKSGGGDWVDPF